MFWVKVEFLTLWLNITEKTDQILLLCCGFYINSEILFIAPNITNI